MFPFFFELDELREKKKKTGTFSHLPLSLSAVEIKDSKNDKIFCLSVDVVVVFDLF